MSEWAKAKLARSCHKKRIPLNQVVKFWPLLNTVNKVKSCDLTIYILINFPNGSMK